MNLSKLPKRNGKYYYLRQWWTPDVPKKSTRINKKKMVMAVKGNQFKIVHYGDSRYTHNRTNKQWCDYTARAKAITNNQGQQTYKDKFSPNYWSINDLWQKKPHYKNCRSLSGTAYAANMAI